MSYNLTNITGAVTVFDYAVGVNNLTSGYFFVIVVVMIGLISFISMKNYDSSVAFMSASFITFILTAFLWTLGLVNEAWLLGVFVLFLVSLFLNRS